MKKKMKDVKAGLVSYKCCGLIVPDHGQCPECGWDWEGEDVIKDVYGYKVNPNDFTEQIMLDGLSYDEALDLYNKSKDYIESTYEFIGDPEPSAEDLDVSKLEPETIDRRFV